MAPRRKHLVEAGTFGEARVVVHRIAGSVADLTFDTGYGYRTRGLWVLGPLYCGGACTISGNVLEVHAPAWQPSSDDKRLRREFIDPLALEALPVAP